MTVRQESVNELKLAIWTERDPKIKAILERIYKGIVRLQKPLIQALLEAKA